MLVGGGSTTPAIVDRFFGLIGGKDQPILVLPMVRAEPLETGAGSVEMLKERGATNVTIWLKSSPSPSESRDLARQLLAVKGVWIPGGNQNLLMERLGVEWVQKAFASARARGVSFFGTSAGAMLMSDPMIGGNQDDGKPKKARGAGLVSFTVDTHYRERNRQPRLKFAIDNWPEKPSSGVGLSEGEWIVWNNQVIETSGKPEWLIRTP